MKIREYLEDGTEIGCPYTHEEYMDLWNRKRPEPKKSIFTIDEKIALGILILACISLIVATISR